MNDVQIFNSEEFGEIRTVLIDGEPWFVEKDISDALGYTKTGNMTKLIDADDRRVISSSVLEEQVYKQNYQIGITNESGLYAAIFGSTLPRSKEFKKWVTSDILPSVRKTGVYILPNKQDSYMIEDPVERAKRWIEEQEEKKLLEQKIVEQKPKADYFDQLVDSRLLTTFRDCAKEFNIPPNTFTQWLRDQGYIYNDNHNIIKPYAPYVKDGLFQMKDFKTPNGYSNVQTYITVKGKETFRLLLEIYNGKTIEEPNEE